MSTAGFTLAIVVFIASPIQPVATSTKAPNSFVATISFIGTEVS